MGELDGSFGIVLSVSNLYQITFLWVNKWNVEYVSNVIRITKIIYLKGPDSILHARPVLRGKPIDLVRL